MERFLLESNRSERTRVNQREGLGGREERESGVQKKRQFQLRAPSSPSQVQRSQGRGLYCSTFVAAKIFFLRSILGDEVNFLVDDVIGALKVVIVGADIDARGELWKPR